jgi:hypothetical protein
MHEHHPSTLTTQTPGGKCSLLQRRYSFLVSALVSAATTGDDAPQARCYGYGFRESRGDRTRTCDPWSPRLVLIWRRPLEFRMFVIVAKRLERLLVHASWNPLESRRHLWILLDVAPLSLLLHSPVSPDMDRLGFR